MSLPEKIEAKRIWPHLRLRAELTQRRYRALILGFKLRGTHGPLPQWWVKLDRGGRRRWPVSRDVFKARLRNQRKHLMYNERLLSIPEQEDWLSRR